MTATPAAYRQARQALLDGAARDAAMRRHAVPAALVTEPVEPLQSGADSGTTASTAKAPEPAQPVSGNAMSMTASDYKTALADLIARSRR